MSNAAAQQAIDPTTLGFGTDKVDPTSQIQAVRKAHRKSPLRVVVHGMLDAMVEHRMPARFATDVLQHDMTALAQRGATKPLVWVLYASGSHLFEDTPEHRSMISRNLSSDDQPRWYRIANGQINRFGH